MQKNWLVIYKIRIIIKKNPKYQFDVFAVTLTALFFPFLFVLVAAFDFNTKYYDAMNAFINSNINKFTVCKISPGWPDDKNILLMFIKILYGLKQL